MGLIDQLTARALLSRGELREAYREQKQKIEAKAERRRAQAKTRLQMAKVKADKAREMAELESAVYSAEIAAQNAQERARQLRHKAGHYTVGERVGKFAGDAYKVGGAFVKGLTTSDTRSRRKTTRRR